MLLPPSQSIGLYRCSCVRAVSVQSASGTPQGDVSGFFADLSGAGGYLHADASPFDPSNAWTISVGMHVRTHARVCVRVHVRVLAWRSPKRRCLHSACRVASDVGADDAQRGQVSSVLVRARLLFARHCASALTPVLLVLVLVRVRFGRDASEYMMLSETELSFDYKYVLAFRLGVSWSHFCGLPCPACLQRVVSTALRCALSHAMHAVIASNMSGLCPCLRSERCPVPGLT